MARRLPYFLGSEQIAALFAAAVSDRDLLLLFVLGHTGLRVSELCRLRVEDLDLERGLLWVRLGKGAKDRSVPLSAVLRDGLRIWLGDRREGVVFPSPRGGGPMTPRAVQKLVKRMAAAAGLPGAAEARRVTPHKLRHFFASRLLETGATIREVQELLGHASVATTQVYLHADPRRLREAVGRL